MTQTITTGRPAVFISIADLERLIDLLPETIPPTAPGAALLAEEIARAQVCAEGEMPARIVRLGSRVTYRDLVTGRIRSVQLVMPADADADEAKVSILAPIGAALIGLPEDQAFSWLEPTGAERHIQVLAIENEDL